MTKRRLLKRATGVGMMLVLMSLPQLSGCTAYIGAKERQVLADAQKAAESAEADLAACKQKRTQLERDLAQKKQELAKLQKTRDAVRNALGM